MFIVNVSSSEESSNRDSQNYCDDTLSLSLLWSSLWNQGSTKWTLSLVNIITTNVKNDNNKE